MFSLIICATVAIVTSQIDFIVIGDWGGQNSAPYTTPIQLNTADIMGKIADEYNISFVILLGDNFYEHGINGFDNINDRRFNDTFESVYNATGLQNIPFYVVPGNHDYEGNITTQILYTNKSLRWTMPDRYYNNIWNIPNTNYTLEIIFIDTVMLAGGLTPSSQPPNNPYLDNDYFQPSLEYIYEHNLYDDYLKEWEWVESKINNSNADFLFIAGHYPVYSVGTHGTTLILEDKLNPILLDNNVQFYISGHDHTLEYISNDIYPNTGYIVSGAGAYCTNSTHHENRVPINSVKYHSCLNNYGGFVRINVGNNGTKGVYYLSNEISYETPIIPPRFQ